MTEKMKVLSLQVKDVLGAREFALEAGKITTINGRNGSGKTSALEALKSAIGGGKLANLSRVGNVEDEVEPEVVLVLEGEDGQRFLVEKDAKKTRVRAQVGESAAFEDVPKPQRWLDGLFDGRLANPISFLDAAEKDRVLLLLGAIDFDYRPAELWGRLSVEREDLQPIPDGIHPLQEIALIREAIFRERTGVNRDATSKAQSAEQLLREIPAVLPDGYEDEIEKLDADVGKLSDSITMARAEARAECEKQKREVEAALKETMHEINSEASEKIAEIRARAEAEIADVTREADLQINLAKSSADEHATEAVRERDDIIESLEEDAEELAAKREQLAELRTRQEGAVKAVALRDQADMFAADAEALKKRSDALTGDLQALDKYRAELASDLPIKGLEIRNEGKRPKIYVNGIEFAQLNTAQQIDIAVKVACIRAKKQRLPVVWVDGAERLDSENFAALKSALDAEGVQAFIARVTDGELGVEVE